MSGVVRRFNIVTRRGFISIGCETGRGRGRDRESSI